MLKNTDIIKLIESSGLVGRGGASFPVAKKLAAVKEALVGKKSGYIIINGAEGEPGVKKDGHIIEHYPEEVINGVFAADKFLGPEKIKRIYFFLNRAYYRDYGQGLKKELRADRYARLRKKLEFVVKPEGLDYICGEESALLNLIEGRKIEPRLKPPYPTEAGLFGMPTLINNTETFYNISLVARGCFRDERFYTIAGAVRHRGVFSLPASLTAAEVLEKTDNYPDFKFFAQLGGEASGEVLRSDQLDRPVGGAGSIMVYDLEGTDKEKLLLHWLDFYRRQSCGQCTTCREGTYRLWKMAQEGNYDWKLFRDLVSALDETSFCALGRSLPVPIKSYFSNIL